MEYEADNALFINANEVKEKVQIGKCVKDIQGCLPGIGICHVESTAPVVFIKKLYDSEGWWYVETDDGKTYYVVEQ